MDKIRIAILVGSLRKESINLKLAKSIIEIAEPHIEFDIVNIANLPLYNQDDDEIQAESVLWLKTQIRWSDGVLFVTPEYNRSIPGVLKNALDHGSRPYGQNVWAKKPAGIIGISPSPVGTAIAQQHLRVILATLDMPTLCQPEMFLQMKTDFFNSSGGLSTNTRQFIANWFDQFLHWIATHKSN